MFLVFMHDHLFSLKVISPSFKFLNNGIQFYCISQVLMNNITKHVLK